MPKRTGRKPVMKRSFVCLTFVCLTVVFSLLPSSVAKAVDLKNLRPCYGKLGATRQDNTVLPNDYFFLMYDIERLATDPKNGKVSYITTLELTGPDKTVQKLPPTPNEAIPELGGKNMPGEAFLRVRRDDPPGKYTLKLTVYDKIAKKEVYAFQTFTVVADTFGITDVNAPAVGFPGQHYVPRFVLVNSTLDGPKGSKFPKVEISMRILEKGKPVAETVKTYLPDALPFGMNLEEFNAVPLSYPIYVNRPGRYTMEIGRASCRER